jgi:glycosyltransferase involved in cell wall biosynthesis
MPSSPPQPDFTILIPLYNEAPDLTANLLVLMRFLEERRLCAEIILGSNGSDDGTPVLAALLQAAFPDSVRFFHLEERGVVGEVFKRAVAMASSPLLLSLDADLSVDMEFIPRALDLLGKNDVVVGSKRSGSQSRSTLRRSGSAAFILCAQTLLRLPYDDYSIGGKGYRVNRIRQWVRGLSADTNYVLALLHRCRRAELSIAVLPVACEDWRKSRFNLTREALVRFSHLLRFWLRGLTAR